MYFDKKKKKKHLDKGNCRAGLRVQESRIKGDAVVQEFSSDSYHQGKRTTDGLVCTI